ncbi:MAG: hypothetical protein KAS32_04530 [Candidatus Peribacteraceae bacterium]|nr:hypothetical protein [Candidatus Peribacteraceae bacterium]
MKKVDINEFDNRLYAIYPDPNNVADEEAAHGLADDLLVETLESLGYDLSLFKSADKWYA